MRTTAVLAVASMVCRRLQNAVVRPERRSTERSPTRVRWFGCLRALTIMTPSCSTSLALPVNDVDHALTGAKRGNPGQVRCQREADRWD
jgi:hypothetical protein